MANKKVEIMELRKILRLHQQGKSDRFIANNLGISRNTVSKYLELSKISGYSIDDLMQLNNEQLDSIINPILKARPKKLKELEILFSSV